MYDKREPFILLRETKWDKNERLLLNEDNIWFYPLFYRNGFIYMFYSGYYCDFLDLDDDKAMLVIEKTC